MSTVHHPPARRVRDRAELSNHLRQQSGRQRQSGRPRKSQGLRNIQKPRKSQRPERSQNVIQNPSLCPGQRPSCIMSKIQIILSKSQSPGQNPRPSPGQLGTGLRQCTTRILSPRI